MDAVSIESEAAPFVDYMQAHFIEWGALLQAIKDQLNLIGS